MKLIKDGYKPLVALGAVSLGALVNEHYAVNAMLNDSLTHIDQYINQAAVFLERTALYGAMLKPTLKSIYRNWIKKDEPIINGNMVHKPFKWALNIAAAGILPAVFLLHTDSYSYNKPAENEAKDTSVKQLPESPIRIVSLDEYDLISKDMTSTEIIKRKPVLDENGKQIKDKNGKPKEIRITKRSDLEYKLNGALKYEPEIRRGVSEYLTLNFHPDNLNIRDRVIDFFTNLTISQVAQESGGVNMISSMGAEGGCGYMKSAAKDDNIHIDNFVDNRFDYVTCSKAAVGRIIDFFEDSGSLETAYAKYNAGPRRVNKAIQKARNSGLEDPENFYTYERYLSKETQNYVREVLAMANILNNQGKYDVDLVRDDSILSYETYIVKDGDTSWSIASREGISVKELEDLNRGLRSIERIKEGMEIRVPD